MKDISPLIQCRKLLPLLVMIQLFGSPVFSQQPYWQQQVNVVIDVTLNDREHSLDGFEKITYVNHSPDTLFFLWFHIWPNAFKNDRTAFSEQLLKNGRTDFYFSKKEQRGYINRLDFKINGVTAVMEDHPQHIDIVKILLPTPLLPGASVNITTPFHVQLPENFSRGGHHGQAYQVTQWYPKPAVYDRKGWHPMPYLDQGEFYSEFGSYDVRITLPSNYIVAATGELQDQAEKNMFKTRQQTTTDTIRKNTAKKTARSQADTFPPSAATNKTLRFVQDNVHDFAWFADKRFVVDFDTLQLSSGKLIEVFSYHINGSRNWKNSISYLKEAVKTRSAWIGEYPYPIISAVEAEMGFPGGMEYPTITSISPMESEKANDLVIAHEVGHNWFQGILASNERIFPWMDEGMNSYYDDRYEKIKYREEQTGKETFQSKRFPTAFDHLVFESMAEEKLDQPVNTPAAAFSEINYGLIGYHKAALWMKKLEETLGRTMFDSCMQAYYSRWQFKHPYPEDFKFTIENVSGRDLDELFGLLDKKGSLVSRQKKSVKMTSYFNLKETDKNQYISIAPAFGYNKYDGLQLGGLVHNYQLPLPRLQFLIAPLYGTASKHLNGLARIAYNWYPAGPVQKFQAGAAVSSFSMDMFETGGYPKRYLKFMKLAPFLRVNFKTAPAGTVRKSAQLKWYFINEDDLEFKQEITAQDTIDVINTVKNASAIGELKYLVRNERALYPYQAEFNLQFHKEFIRAAITGNYFYNYASNKGGIKLRWFAGKFMYTAPHDRFKGYKTERYHLNLTGPRGYEDYTYSNYFIGRNEFEGIGSQQLMIRDGGFKVGTDLLDAKVGKTDDWLGALNFTVHIPDLSDHFPLKLFFDIGTYADAWKKDASGSRFLYDAGLQLSLFKQTLNIYVPVLYSKVYKDYFRSTLGDKRFLKTISFSVDIQDLTMKKISRELPL